MSDTLQLARSAFPERDDKAEHAMDQWARGLLRSLRGMAPASVRSEVARLARAQQRQGQALAQLDDDTLRARLRELAPAALRERRRADLDGILLMVGEAARRAVGLLPHPSQLFGAGVMLRGQLAEMATGEGKTLTAGLAACVAGVGGIPVHVVTVNDYLAERDAATMGPLYAFAGLRVGVVHHGIQPHERRLAYACDVTYCTNKELVFDYLRDRVAARGRASAAQLRSRQLYGGAALQPLALRGLHFAIVDECDSVLIDEARTPLILAEKAGAVDHAAALPQALCIAATLERGLHWSLNAARREVRLTDAGRAHVTTSCADLGAPWPAAHVREHLLVQALCALHLYQRDHQYLVDAEGTVQIIDEYTGRVLPGRTWEQGLHQMIETKEGVSLSEQTRTLARITYQRFFCRYLRLAGMTGTARELAPELAAVYRLHTVVVPTHRPVARRLLAPRLCADTASKWQAVAAFAAARQAAGQPVLVGTRSVEASEELSAVLAAHAVDHQVLNARQDAQEAAIVAAAGRRGSVTVATNMAGRGTDIALGDGAAALGGLCVVLTEFHESPRIDRQLFGRGARQGDPGCAVAIVALDDGLFSRHGGAATGLLGWALRVSPTGMAFWLERARAAAQGRAERMHARTRRDTLKQDRQLDKMMSISGDPL